MKELAEIQEIMKSKESEIENMILIEKTNVSKTVKRLEDELRSEIEQLRLERLSLSDKNLFQDNMIKNLQEKKMELEAKISSLESQIKFSERATPIIPQESMENENDIFVQNEVEENTMLPKSLPVALHTEISGAEKAEIEYLNSMMNKYKQDIQEKTNEAEGLKKQITQLKDYSMEDNHNHREELGNYLQRNEQLQSQLQSHENQFEKQMEINKILENEKVVLQKENDILEKEQKLLKENIKYYQTQITKIKKRKNSEPITRNGTLYIELENPTGKDIPIRRVKQTRVFTENEQLLGDEDCILEVEVDEPEPKKICCTIM